MDSITVQELVEATGGRLIQGGADEVFAGVSTDSRTIRPGELFVPLAGERFDGHRFILKALGAGGAGFVFGAAGDRPAEERLAELELALPLTVGGRRPFAVAVPDTLAALHGLAAAYRRRFTLPVVGVTGSVGKTSTKDLIAAVLRTRWRTVATQGNLNNEIGLPLTVFALDHSTEAACFELGMRGLGQIRALAEIVRPTVGVVTNVGETHLELLGTRENIARAKAELIEALPADGVAVLNADDPRVAAMEGLGRARVLRYGFLQPGERPSDRRLTVAGEGVGSHGVQGVGFTAVLGERRFPVRLAVPGVHNAGNALAAFAVGLALGLEPEKIVEGLAQARLSGMRLEVRRGSGGFTLINDAYNASPASVRAALNLLVESRAGGAVVAVLGDMRELGEHAEEAHRQIGAYAAALGVDRLVGVGPLAAHMVRAARVAGLARAEAYDTTAAAAAALATTLQPADVVLVKGSRAMHMEDIVHELTGVEAGTHE
ncbi:MAG TPA: UDP-N-acetylmuramoyl-tripeptide--D-alanyl-D-alanine ligase [Firmicutes bacterium]|nr:UDP-N-acetylmuramoyl-tripeptide--D-alanyl-D-alanine ligase [Bacillota bacterium]